MVTITSHNSLSSARGQCIPPFPSCRQAQGAPGFGWGWFKPLVPRAAVKWYVLTALLTCGVRLLRQAGRGSGREFPCDFTYTIGHLGKIHTEHVLHFKFIFIFFNS